MSVPFSPDSALVERFILSQPKKLHELFFSVQHLILESHVDIKQTFKYRVPFYGIKRNVCYLNSNKKKDAILIGFVSGAKLSEIHPSLASVLIGNELKSVRHLEIKSIKDDGQFEHLLKILKMAIEYSLSR